MSFYIQQFRKRHILRFFCGIKLLLFHCNILMPTVKYDTYKVMSFMNENRKERKFGLFLFFKSIKTSTKYYFASLFPQLIVKLCSLDKVIYMRLADIKIKYLPAPCRNLNFKIKDWGYTLCLIVEEISFSSVKLLYNTLLLFIHSNHTGTFSSKLSWRNAIKCQPTKDKTEKINGVLLSSLQRNTNEP